MPDDNRIADLTPSLVVRLRAGDPDAGSVLDRLYRRSMVRFCWGYLGTDPDAEDAVQEIFYKAIKATVVPDNFRAWLYKIARNHCLNIIRNRARRPDEQELPAESRLYAEMTGNVTRMVREELRSRIMHLIGTLPVSQREVLRLRYVEELSRSDIAFVVGVSESVVKSRLFEGIKKLRGQTSLLESE